MLEGFLKGLKQPEYIHVLINPLPVYGLAMGLIGLIIGLMLRSREARIGAFALILIAAASAWPTFHYGQQGYDRVKGMADSEGQKWLDEHKPINDQLAEYCGKNITVKGKLVSRDGVNMIENAEIVKK